MSATLISDKLKAALLQSAIQGKLTQQLPEDGDARDLLKQIKAEKERLINEKVIKKEKPLPEITEDEIPFDIPDNWVWVRLGDLANYRKGPFGSSLTKSMFVPKGNNTIKVYEQKNAIQKNDKLGEYYIKDTYYLDKMTSFTLNGGDIIVSCAGTIGESYILPEQIELGIINQALMRVRCYSKIFKQFYLYIFDFAIRSPIARENVKGSAIKNIPPFEILKNILVPLPPLAEQHRIVEAIEKALAKIDKLKVDETKLYNIQKAFPTKLRASLLQSAIQGKLTQQLPEDGDARDLLKQIKAEKERLINEKIIKKEKPLPEITEDEIPFDIPDNWVWVRMIDLCLIITDGTHHRPKYTVNGIPFLSVKNITNGFLDLENTKFISEIEHRQLIKRCHPQKGDLLLSKVGTTGVPLVIDTDIEFSIFVSLALLKLPKQIYNHFLCMMIQSPLAQKQAKSETKGVGNKNWVLRDISKMVIPLPPLAEQHRIVEVIEMALAKIDKLNKLTE